MDDIKGKHKKLGVRTGREYLSGLQDDREIWTGGKRIKDVTNHSATKRCAETLAGFFDKQISSNYLKNLTYLDADGIRCAISFKPPKSVKDIKERGKAYYEWAKWSHGMFGRTPDYKNASIMSFAIAKSWLDQGKERGLSKTLFSENIENYYNFIRLNDKVLTHTLVNPQKNYEVALEGKYDDEVALHVVKETDAGIVVKGARLLATLGPIADEIEVFPSTLLKGSEDNLPFAFAFALPIATPGIKLIARDTYDHGKSNFDAPLSSRFEEMDAVVIFDNVLVPWERVFMYREPLLCNQAFSKTNAVVHMMHQVACSKLAKSEFMVGLMVSIVKASGKDKDISIKNLISEVMMMTETIKALLYSSESHAHIDEWGHYIPLRKPIDTSRNLFPTMYPRMVEILQLLGSSSLMATPSEADFKNELKDDVKKYFQMINVDSKKRISLFRLAHDVCISGFGNRQALYERFFFGPPAIMKAGYFDLYQSKDLEERIDLLLKDSGN